MASNLELAAAAAAVLRVAYGCARPGFKPEQSQPNKWLPTHGFVFLRIRLYL